jgi:hypothetical protein
VTTTATVEVDEDELTAAAGLLETRSPEETLRKLVANGFIVLTDDGDYAHQISAVRPELRVRMVSGGPG